MITIRDAAEADVEAVLRFWQGAEALPTTTDDAAGLRSLLAHPTASLLLAVDGGEIVGSVIAAFDGWRGGIYRLAVHPSHRRLGLASRLVREAVARLEAAGARRIAAMARTEEPQAIGFWASGGGAGFERAAPFVRYVRG